jgi:hypothetical protein
MHVVGICFLYNSNKLLFYLSKKMSMRFFIILFFFSSTILAQTEYPKDYFSPPLDTPMLLSGNFGELRPNHFHRF